MYVCVYVCLCVLRGLTEQRGVGGEGGRVTTTHRVVHLLVRMPVLPMVVVVVVVPVPVPVPVVCKMRRGVKGKATVGEQLKAQWGAVALAHGSRLFTVVVYVILAA